MALDRLRKLDHIAYVFFASVYQSFDDLEQLKREVDRLYAERLGDAPGQTSLELVPQARGAAAGARGNGAGRRTTRR